MGFVGVRKLDLGDRMYNLASDTIFTLLGRNVSAEVLVEEVNRVLDKRREVVRGEDVRVFTLADVTKVRKAAMDALVGDESGVFLAYSIYMNVAELSNALLIEANKRVSEGTRGGRDLLIDDGLKKVLEQALNSLRAHKTGLESMLVRLDLQKTGLNDAWAFLLMSMISKAFGEALNGLGLGEQERHVLLEGVVNSVKRDLLDVEENGLEQATIGVS